MLLKATQPQTYERATRRRTPRENDRDRHSRANQLQVENGTVGLQTSVSISDADLPALMEGRKAEQAAAEHEVTNVQVSIAERQLLQFNDDGSSHLTVFPKTQHETVSGYVDEHALGDLADVKPYANAYEQAQAFAHPRYKDDPSFRLEVNQRLMKGIIAGQK